MADPKKTGFFEIHAVDPFATSMILYSLVSINSLVDVNYRLLELGAANLNTPKTRFFWYYFSSSLSYFIRSLFGLFVLILLVCIIAAIITVIIKVFAGTKDTGLSANAIMQTMKSDLSRTVLDEVKKTADFIMNVYTIKSDNKFMYKKLPDLIKLFMLLLPLFMLLMTAAFAISLYTPIINPDEESKKSSVMSTNHHYIYFMLVFFVIIFIGLFLYTYIKTH